MLMKLAVLSQKSANIAFFLANLVGTRSSVAFQGSASVMAGQAIHILPCSTTTSKEPPCTTV